MPAKAFLYLGIAFWAFILDYIFPIVGDSRMKITVAQMAKSCMAAREDDAFSRLIAMQAECDWTPIAHYGAVVTIPLMIVLTGITVWKSKQPTSQPPVSS